MDDDDDDDGIFESSTSEHPRYSAVFEDDGEVAYGYLLIDGRIVSDVWLYNRDEAPGTSPWKDGPQGRFLPVEDAEDVSFVWTYGPGQVPTAVEFWIRGRLHARVTPDCRPGWCVLAIEDGPLARKLD